MPVEIVRDVIKRCKANNLKAWEQNLKQKNNLNCKSLGETVASIVQVKIDKSRSKFNNNDLSSWEVYQSLAYVDSLEVEGILNMNKPKVFELIGKEVFACGKWKGDEYTDKDLNEMISAFQSLDFKPALKIHHEPNKENDKVELLNPALGYVSNLYKKGKKLVADFSNMPEKVFNAIKNGAYSRISSEVAWNLKRGGKVYKRALTAVSLLGADVPAVADLDTLNGLYSYSADDDIHSYDFGVGELKAYGGTLAWEDTKDSYIYWSDKFNVIKNQIDSVIKEEVEDGVNKLTTMEEVIDSAEFISIKIIVGWEFMKSNFNLIQSKNWIEKRKDRDLFSEEIVDVKLISKDGKKFFNPDTDKWEDKKESQPMTKTEKFTKEAILESAEDIDEKEKKMADEKLETRLKELEKKLSEQDTKLSESDTKIKELQTKDEKSIKDFSDKETELQNQLKEAEEKSVKLSAEQTKLETENKKYAEDKEKLESEAKEKEVDVFIAEHKTAGRVLPRFENQVKALLSVDVDESKVCEFTIDGKEGKETKKLSIADTVKDLIKSLPKSVDYSERSEDNQDDFTEDTGDILDKKIKAHALANKISYSKAYSEVLSENPDLAKKYANSRV